MSQPDLLTQLREARPVAPPELRERVRLVAAQATPPRRRITWRRAFVVVVPVAAAVVAAAVLLPGGNRPKQFRRAVAELTRRSRPDAGAAPTGPAPQASADPGASSSPSPSRSRIQKYSASLELRLRDAAAVSEATKQAVKIASSLSGYLTSVNVTAEGRTGYARPRAAHPGRARAAGGQPALRARDDRRRERLDPGSPGTGRRDRTADRAPPAPARLMARAAADRRHDQAHRRAHDPDRAPAARPRRDGAHRAVRDRPPPADDPPGPGAGASRPRPAARPRRHLPLGRDRRRLRTRARHAADPLLALRLARRPLGRRRGARSCCSANWGESARRRGTSARPPAARRTPG